MVSLILSAPVILYRCGHLLRLLCTNMNVTLVVPLLVSSSLLFYIGMAFAYFVVFPLAFGFLANTAPQGVQVSTDIASYLSFVMALFMAFGVSFEVPVAIVLLCWMGITTPEDLRKKRPYVVVGAFVVGMLLTPPDVFSQTLLAIPMYCLFEVGVSSLVSMSVSDVREMRTTRLKKQKKPKPPRKQKSKFNRPSGRLSYGR